MSFQVLNVDGQLPEWLDSLATVNLLQATPGKLVMFLTERFKWPGQMDLVLGSFWNGWKMLEVGLGGSRAGTLEPNFSKSYFALLSLLPTNVPRSPSVGVSGHCSFIGPSHSSLSGTATRVLVGPPPCKRGDLACDLWGPSCGVAWNHATCGGRRGVYFMQIL